LGRRFLGPATKSNLLTNQGSDLLSKKRYFYSPFEFGNMSGLAFKKSAADQQDIISNGQRRFPPVKLVGVLPFAMKFVVNQ